MANLTENEKKMLMFEGIFVAGALIYLFFSMVPSGNALVTGNVIEGPIVFEIENGATVLISSNNEFSNFIEIREGEEVQLPPGDYFWKVKGILRESEVYTFTIESKVGLNLREGEETNILENSGNVPLEVNKRGITSGTPIEIEVGKSNEIEKENETYEGGQDD